MDRRGCHRGDSRGRLMNCEMRQTHKSCGQPYAAARPRRLRCSCTTANGTRVPSIFTALFPPLLLTRHIITYGMEVHSIFIYLFIYKEKNTEDRIIKDGAEIHVQTVINQMPKMRQGLSDNSASAHSRVLRHDKHPCKIQGRETMGGETKQPHQNIYSKGGARQMVCAQDVPD